DPALAQELDTRFEALQAELTKYVKGDGFIYYNELTPQQVQDLAMLVDALGEPLSKLTAAVVL
ncbi:MAG: PbrT family lead (Pb2+) uptake porter, partial [Arthrobacter sp.]